MRKNFFILIIIFIFTNQTNAIEPPVLESLTSSTEINYNDVQKDNDDYTTKSGCCSHHGGVCGCALGETVCCDGTISPTCGC